METLLLFFYETDSLCRRRKTARTWEYRLISLSYKKTKANQSVWSVLKSIKYALRTFVLLSNRNTSHRNGTPQLFSYETNSLCRRRKTGRAWQYRLISLLYKKTKVNNCIERYNFVSRMLPFITIFRPVAEPVFFLHRSEIRWICSCRIIYCDMPLGMYCHDR